MTFTLSAHKKTNFAQFALMWKIFSVSVACGGGGGGAYCALSTRCQLTYDRLLLSLSFDVATFATVSRNKNWHCHNWGMAAAARRVRICHRCLWQARRSTPPSLYICINMLSKQFNRFNTLVLQGQRAPTIVALISLLPHVVHELLDWGAADKGGHPFSKRANE